jgi:hypothetical protein
MPAQVRGHIAGFDRVVEQGVGHARNLKPET